MLDPKGLWRGLRTKDVKYARWPDGRCLLFRLDHDPDEMAALDCADAVELDRITDRLFECRGRECALLEDAPAGALPPPQDPDGAGAACRGRSIVPILDQADPLGPWHGAPSSRATTSNSA